jgi:HEAT repeat protein
MLYGRPRTTIYYSYSGHDSALAIKLAADLKNAGFDLWVEQLDGTPTKAQLAATEDKLKQCCLVMPVISPNYSDEGLSWAKLKQLIDAADTSIFPILTYDAEIPGWITKNQTIDFCHWRNEQLYRNRLEKIITILKIKFPDLARDIPDEEVRYMNGIVADIERHKALLGIISARSNTLPTDKSAIYAQSMWGLTGTFEAEDNKDDQEDSTYQFHEVIEKYPRFILKGAAGAGKTTVLYRAMLDVLRAYQSKRDEFPLPFMLHLGQWREKVSFETFLQTNWPFEGDPSDLLPSGQILLLLDGLDEIRHPIKSRVVSLQKWLNSNSAPLYIIIACNNDGFGDYKLNLPIINIKAIDDPYIRQFVINHVEKEVAEPLLKQILPEETSSNNRLSQIAHNFLYLATMISAARKESGTPVPGHEALLLKWLANTLWNGQKSDAQSLPLEALFPALSKLAFSMIDNQTGSYVSYDYALQHVGEETALQIALDSDILQMRNNDVSFCHCLLQDYFATYWLMVEEGVYTRIAQAKFTQDGQRINGKWDRIIKFCSAVSPNPDMLVNEIVDVNPYLAFDCIKEGIVVEAKTQRNVVGRLLQYIQGEDRAYMPKLIKLLKEMEDSEIAATLLEHLYSSPHSMSTNGNVEDITMPGYKTLGKKTVKLLLDILRGDRWQRRRGAAWTLGKLKEPQAVAGLIEVLIDENADVRKEADYALARIGMPALPRLIKSLQHKDPDMRGAVIKVLGRIAEPDTVPHLIASLTDTDWPQTEEVRVCDLAAIALEHIGTEEALSAIDAWREHVKTKAANSKLHARIRSSQTTIIDTEKSLDELVADLQRQEWSVRRDAVEAMGLLDNENAIPHIQSMLDDEDRMVRWTAVKALDNFASQEAVIGLTQALRDEDSMVYDVAASALSKRGEPAIPGLVAAISNDNVDLRGSAIEALGEIGSETAIPYLVDALQDTECPQWEDNSICDLAADALKRIGTEQALLALDQWLKHNPHVIPEPVAHTEQEFTSLLQLDEQYHTEDRHRAALIDFLDALEEGDWKNQHKIAKDLRQHLKTLDDPQGIEEVQRLSGAMGNDETIVRWTATEALALIGDETATSSLLHALHDKSWTVRLTAIRGMVNMKKDAAITGLLQVIDDKNPLVREAVAETLGKLGNPDISEYLTKMLEDDDDFVRRAAAESLGGLTDESVVDSLVTALQNENESVVTWAIIEALNEIKGEASVPILIEYLADTHKPEWEDKRICDLAADALENIGTQQAQDALEQWRLGQQ